MIAAWHWIGAHGLSLLVVTYFANVACTILLAGFAYSSSRRIGRLTKESARQAVLLEELEMRAALQMLEIAAHTGNSGTVSATNKTYRGPFGTLACVREELAMLQSEFVSKGAIEPLPESLAAPAEPFGASSVDTIAAPNSQAAGVARDPCDPRSSPPIIEENRQS